MIVEVDPRSPVPPYEQIRAQVLRYVATGALAAGTQLPPIRQLAADLGVANGTVARAYRELEVAGVIVGRGRRGSIVVEHAQESAVVQSDRARTVTEAARDFAATARTLGYSLQEAVDVLRRAAE